MTHLNLPGFREHRLFDRLPFFFTGRLPAELDGSARTQFEELWNLHPEKSNEILIHGRMVAIPRWQQAYGRDYYFSGTTSPALPVPDLLLPFLRWVREAIDPRLNGLFWTRIGSAWPHKDGKGLNLVLSALPINGRLVLREYTPEDEKKDDEKKVAKFQRKK